MAAAICAGGQRQFAELFLKKKIGQMYSNIGFEMSFIVVKAGNTWPMCDFHDSNGNGFGDIWWTDKLFYFSSIDYFTKS